MPIIYKITNSLNGKVYIGKTVKSLEERIRNHIDNTKKPVIKERPLYRAINKYGIENFSIEVIEECMLGDEDDREVFWIEKYDSYNNGYNATMGGDGKRLADYELVFSLFEKGLTVKEIKNQTGYDKYTISKALNIFGVSNYERARRKVSVISKPVVMIDKNTGEELKIFNSILEAEEFLGVSYNSHIAKVCKGQRKTSCGYMWKFLEDIPNTKAELFSFDTGWESFKEMY